MKQKLWPHKHRSRSYFDVAFASIFDCNSIVLFSQSLSHLCSHFAFIACKCMHAHWMLQMFLSFQASLPIILFDCVYRCYVSWSNRLSSSRPNLTVIECSCTNKATCTSTTPEGIATHKDNQCCMIMWPPANEIARKWSAACLINHIINS